MSGKGDRHRSYSDKFRNAPYWEKREKMVPCAVCGKPVLNVNHGGEGFTSAKLSESGFYPPYGTVHLACANKAHDHGLCLPFVF